MKKTKYIVATTFVLIMTISLLCACLPNATQSVDIVFFNNKMGSPAINIGKFNVANERNDNYSKQFEIRPKDKAAFVEFLQNCDYYIGAFTLNEDSYYLSKTYRCMQFNGGDTCMWFAKQGNIWIGKYYAEKFYYLTNFSFLSLNLENVFWVEISEALFLGSEKPTLIGEEYNCAFTWEQLKLIYSDSKIDDENHTIELECHIYYEENQDISNGKTLLLFDTAANTITISGNYYI